MQGELEKALVEFSLQMMGSTRVQKRRLPRRNVLGASNDIARAMLDYNRSTASYLARMMHAPELNDQLRLAEDSVDAGPAGGAAGRRLLVNEMTKRVTSNQNIQNNHWVQRLLATTLVARLASPMYTLMNLLQPSMITMPVLAGRHGVTKTVNAGTKAMKDLGVGSILKKGLKETKAKALSPSSALETYIDDLKQLPGINAREATLFDKINVRGTLESDKFERARATHGGWATEAGAKLDTTINYLEGVTRQMPTAAEVVNRSWTLLTAYRLEYAANGGNHEAASQYAEDVNNRTNFNYSEAATPPLFKHPLMKIPFQFKRFGHGTYWLLGRLIWQAVRNEEGGRAEALKALAYIAATHTLMAGALGLPTEPIKALVLGAYATGMIGFNWQDVENYERELAADLLGPDLGEMLSRGITRGLPFGLGFDMSSRVGMADLMLAREPNSGNADDIQRWLWDMAIGAPGGMLRGWAEGVQNLAKGEWGEGLQKLVPIKAAADLIKAVNIGSEGKKTPSGRPSMDPYTWSEIVIRTLGATPAREAEDQEFKAYFYSEKAAQDEIRRGLQQRWADASPAGRLRMQGELERYNRNKPRDAWLTRKELMAYTKRRETDIGKTVFGVVPSRTTRPIAERAARTYNQ